METKDSKVLIPCAVLLLALIIFCPFSPCLGAPSVDSPLINPAAITRGVSTSVTISVQINGPSLIGNSVNLQRLDNNGKVVAIVGNLHDDGLNGDGIAGDKIFTIRNIITESNLGQIRLRVSAAFKGLLKRVFSDIIYLRVQEPGFMYGAVWPPDTIPGIKIIRYTTEDGYTFDMDAVIGHVIVQFDAAASQAIAEQLIISKGGSIIGKIPMIGYYLVNVDDEMSFVNEMRLEPTVIYSHPDYLIGPREIPTEWDNIPSLDSRRKVFNDINAPAAWNLLLKDPTLISKLGNIEIGLVDEGFGGFFDGMSDFEGRISHELSIYDLYLSGKHGSQVLATCCAAGNNGFGNVGLNWWSKIRVASMSVGLFYDPKDIFRPVHIRDFQMSKLINNGSKVISLSYGSTGNQDSSCSAAELRKYKEDYKHNFDTIEQIKKNKSEFLVVLAAGNDPCELKREDFNKPDNVIVVSSTGVSSPYIAECIAESYSVKGSLVDIATPEGLQWYDYSEKGYGGFLYGTSFTAPLVTGSAALVWAAEPSLTSQQVVQRLKDTANKCGDGKGITDFGGAGILDVYKALFPPPGASPWPMFHHDAQHTGRSPFAGPANLSNPTVSVFSMGEREDDYFKAPAIGLDGTIYMGARITNGGISKQGVYAFASDGTQKWFYQTPYPEGTPVLYETDGLVYTPSLEGLLAIDIQTGNLKWKKDFAYLYLSQNPVMADDGSLYFISGCIVPDGTFNSCLVSFNKDGEVKWIYAIEKNETYYDQDLPEDCPTGASSSGPSNPTIDKDGTIYFGYSDTLFAINPDGTEKWRRVFPVFSTGGWNYPSQQDSKSAVLTPSIGSDGTVYLTAASEKYDTFEWDWYDCVHAIDPQNHLTDKWPKNCFSYASSLLSIGPDGTLYKTQLFWGRYAWSPTQSLIAIDHSTGQGKWGKFLGYYTGAIQPIVDAEGNIYTSNTSHQIIAFDREGNQKAWAFSLADRSGFLSLDKDGTLFIPGQTYLYIIGP